MGISYILSWHSTTSPTSYCTPMDMSHFLRCNNDIQVTVAIQERIGKGRMENEEEKYNYTRQLNQREQKGSGI